MLKNHEEDDDAMTIVAQNDSTAALARTADNLTPDDIRDLSNEYARGVPGEERERGMRLCRIALGECLASADPAGPVYPTRDERRVALGHLARNWNARRGWLADAARALGVPVMVDFSPVATTDPAGRPPSPRVVDPVADAAPTNVDARAGDRTQLLGEAAYLDLLRRILEHGERRTDRTGTGTLSLFGAQIRFDLRAGFPLLTTKRVPFSPIVRELLWFLRGSTNVRDDLTQHTGIWDAWADPDGDLGPIYGHQWRSWGGRHSTDAGRVPLDAVTNLLTDVDQRGIWMGAHHDLVMGALRELREIRERPGVDQISEAIREIRTRPDSRRIVVSAWNVADVPRMRLPPCHLLFQFYVSTDGCLDCQLYQRSADMALGVPFNIASYALLTSMIARECALTPRYFVHTLGDAHVYLNHMDGVREQLGRTPLPPPRIAIADRRVLDQTFEDVALLGYRHHPAIRFEVSV